MLIVRETYIAPDFSTAFCLRPQEAFAAKIKITMFTFREMEREREKLN